MRISRFCIQLLVIGLILTSCTSQDEVDRKTVEKMSQTILYGLEERSDYEIKEMFSSTRFAMRLGSAFYNFEKMERQYAYAAIRKRFEEEINDYINVLNYNNFKTQLLDITVKDKVYRTIFKITDQSGKYTHNYLVFYIGKNKNEEFKIVNFYNLERGYSFSQMGEQIVADINNQSSTNYEMRAYKARKDIMRAYEIAETGNFSFAYNVMSLVEDRFAEMGNTAYAKMALASKFSDSLHIKELKNLKEMTPNAQSKLLYDCLIQRVEYFKLEFGDCGEAIEASLLSS